MEMSIDASTSTNISGTSFKISDDSSKLFSMLSSFLYSNKELAVLHELSSNAVDAHTMVGKEAVPIEVHLPTNISPNLIVRDFGPGLSPENVIRFLTTYGESNKTKSKNLIGGYGIGSKSPAAVTDTWQVISRHAGVLTHYQILIDNTGVPLLSKLRELATTETGIDVIIPTRPNDINLWTTAARTAYRHYTVRPTIVGKDVSWPVTEFVIQQPDFKIAGDQHKSITAIASGRGYTVELMQISQYLSPLCKKFLLDFQKHVIFEFDIGAFDVDLSREKIRYSDKTIKILTERLDAVGAYFYKAIHDEVDGKNIHEYTIAMMEWDNKFGSAVFNLIEGNPYKIKHSYNLQKLGFDVIDARVYKVSVKGKINVLTKNYTCDRTRAVSAVDSLRAVHIKTGMFDRIMFVKNDHPSVAGRVRYLTKTNVGIVIIGDSFAEFGPAVEPKIILGSSLPAAPKLSKAAVAVIKSPVYELRRNRFFKTDVLDQQKGVLSVWVTFRSANSAGTMVDEGDMRFLEEYYREMGIRVRVLGIKEGTKPPPGIESAATVYARVINFYKALYPSHIEYELVEAIRSNIYYRTFELMITYDGLNAPGDITDICGRANKIRKYEDPITSLKLKDYSLYNALVRRMNLTKPAMSCTINLIIDDFDKIQAKYELLGHISLNSIFDNHPYGSSIMSLSAEVLLAKVIKYVKIVDSAKGVV